MCTGMCTGALSENARLGTASISGLHQLPHKPMHTSACLSIHMPSPTSTHDELPSTPPELEGSRAHRGRCPYQRSRCRRLLLLLLLLSPRSIPLRQPRMPDTLQAQSMPCSCLRGVPSSAGSASCPSKKRAGTTYQRFNIVVALHPSGVCDEQWTFTEHEGSAQCHSDRC